MAKKKVEEVKTEKKKILATVIGDYPLNVREGKTTEAKIIRQLNPGTKVEVLKEGKLWCQIGENEFCMREFLHF